MRQNPTRGEAAFWDLVRGRRLRGRRFRRQVVLDPYIVDFFSRDLDLVVEIDGTIHDAARTSDISRDKTLRLRGIYILRFDEDEVLNRPDRVWKILVAWHDGASHS